MTDEVLRKILKRFGIDDVIISNPQKGYRNSSYLIKAKGEKYNLIIYKRGSDTLPYIHVANDIGLYLKGNTLPVRYPVDDRILKIFASNQPTYACLYNYLDGTTIPWEAYTTKHLINLGMTLSNLHKALSNYVSESLPNAHTMQVRATKRIDAYLQRPGVQEALKRKLRLHVNFQYSNFLKLFKVLRRSVHVQSLHMDFVRGNILFNKSANIVGILDFEKAAIGHPLIDVSRTLAFLLVDCKFKDDQKIIQTFLHRGYQKRGSHPLPRIKTNGTDYTLRILDELTTFFLLYDFYKFLLHNPYEHLKQNEHFVRTRTQLLKRNVLTSI